MDRIQGFCWPLSAAPGETIVFKTSTAAPEFTVTYERFATLPAADVTAAMINNSQEMAPLLMAPPFALPGVLQDQTCTCQSGCDSWTESFTLVVDPDWPSGMYAAHCADTFGTHFYITFIVKPASVQPNRLLLLANTTSWNAYSNWGGYSRYEVNDPNRVYELSFLRPNPEATPVVIDELELNQYIKDKIQQNPSWPVSATDMLIDKTSRHMARGEMWFENWLRMSGYPIDVYSDLDFHSGIDGVQNYGAIILSTHPEYWSLEMFNNLRAYLDAGGSLLYLGGNGLYDRVDFVPGSGLTRMTFKGTMGDRRWRFRDLATQGAAADPIPESGLLGVQYPGAQEDNSRHAYKVKNHSHRFFAGTGLTNGKQIGARGWCIAVGKTDLALGGASGFEIDRTTTSSPPHELLAEGVNPDFAAEMIYYDHQPGGGWVFSAGSITFCGSVMIDKDLQMIVRNALDECAPRGNWPGLWSRDIDAALLWNNAVAYFFKGDRYIRYDVTADVSEAFNPRSIADNWPQLWPDGIDAAIAWDNGKAYLFKGSEYLRYDIATGQPDQAPTPIAVGWKGLWADGIDAAIDWDATRAYFFKGSEYIRYNKITDDVDPEYPLPIAGNWPGLWPDGVDSAINWPNGKVYFFKGDQYIRYDKMTDADEDYPLPINPA